MITRKQAIDALEGIAAYMPSRYQTDGMSKRLQIIEDYLNGLKVEEVSREEIICMDNNLDFMDVNWLANAFPHGVKITTPQGNERE